VAAAEAVERLAALAGAALTLAMLLPYPLHLGGWALYAYYTAVAAASYTVAWLATGVWRRGGEARR